MTSDAGAPGAPRFDVVLRGYDRRQVDEHVERLQRVLARMRADLEVARSQPMPAVRPAAAAPPRPTPRPRPGVPGGGSPDTIGNFTDRMQSILQAAEEEAAEIRRAAQRAARAETDGVRTQLADLTRQRDAVLAELTRMRGQLEGMLAAPTAAMPARESRPAPGRPSPGPSSSGPPSSGPPSSGPPSPGPTAHEVPPTGQQAAARPRPAAAAQQAPAQQAPAQQAPTPGPNGSPAASGGPAPRPKPAPSAAPAVATNGAGPKQPAGDAATPRSRPGEAPTVAAPREPNKAAHRLPTGAYPAVTESSMRPRNDPQPEPAELFRPVPGGRGDAAEQRTTASPQAQAPQAKPQRADQPADDRTAMVRATRPADESAPARPAAKAGGAESTVKVGAVRPSDPTVLSPVPGPPERSTDEPAGAPRPGSGPPASSTPPGPAAGKPAPGKPSSGGSNGTPRPTSSSRSG